MKTFRSKVVAALGLSLFGMASGSAAAADPSITDKSVAAELFKEGRALLEQGRIGPACRKLEESQRIDPGGGTLLNLALCHEREGRTATAWVEFTEALGIAKRDGRPQRIEFARAHLTQLEPALSRLYIEVPSAADLPDLEIKRDGSVLGRAAWASPVPVDPGDHVIEASAAGKLPWKQSVVVGLKADTRTVVIPSLEDAPPQENAPVQLAAPVTTTVSSRAPASPDVSSPPARPTRDRPQEGSSVAGLAAAWIAMGLGVAASGVATYFALHAVSLKSEADRNCAKETCSALGAAQNSDAIKSANFATIGFGVGALGVGLGTILFITRAASHGDSSAADRAPAPILTGCDMSVGPGRGEVTVSARW
jgi:hypothetical protein